MKNKKIYDKNYLFCNLYYIFYQIINIFLKNIFLKVFKKFNKIK